MHNNRITKIATNISTCIPNLEWLMLNNNRISELNDLKPLEQCKKLTHLSLIDNPITSKQNYRLYVIHSIPSLRMLDFKKVKLRVCTPYCYI